jgi:Ca2+-binding EF-hand superfamily protein
MKAMLRTLVAFLVVPAVTAAQGPTAKPGSVLGPQPRIVKPPFRLPAGDLGIVDTYDVLFFGESRLIHLRVHLNVAGEPLSKRWMQQLKSYFDFLDRDGDGFLNPHEAEFAFTNAGVNDMLRSGFAYQRPDDAARMFKELDIDGDGRVSFDEFAAYYSPSAARVISASQSPVTDAYAEPLTDALFKLFDTNKDGKLSRSELTAVEGLFAKLDADEDECLSALEMAPTVFRPARDENVETDGAMMTRPKAKTIGPAGPSTMLVFPAGTIPDSIGEMILKKYAKSGSLQEAGNPLGEEAFRFLDRDGNGEVSAAELRNYKRAPADLELDMTLGNKPGENVIRIRPRADGKQADVAAGFRFAGNETAMLTVEKQTIQLSCYTPPGVYGDTGRGTVLEFPKTKNGYVTDKEIVGPQYQSLRVLFDMIDRDGDGKLTKAEFDSFVSLQKSFTRLPLSLVYAAQTPSLFQLMDENGDGRLTVREVRSAWDRLIALEPLEKDYVTRAALKPQGALRFGRSSDVLGFSPQSAYFQQPVRQAATGPLWFRKFDRNGDGEVSRSEFPGTREEFDRIDTNHDGYITVEEAEAYDKKARPKK